MAFQRVGVRKYPDLKAAKDGDLLVDGGVYKGSEQGKMGTIHVFKAKDGADLVLAGGHLNYLMSKYAVAGDLCNVYYKGKTLLTKGPMAGKEAHNYDLHVDADYRMPAAAAEGGSATPVTSTTEVPSGEDITL